MEGGSIDHNKLGSQNNKGPIVFTNTDLEGAKLMFVKTGGVVSGNVRVDKVTGTIENSDLRKVSLNGYEEADISVFEQ
jgi:hypothetical protein